MTEPTLPPPSVPLPTVWVLGDQLNREIGPLRGFGPDQCRVLLVTSDAKLHERRWHTQRLHLVLSAMAHFAAELERDGYVVDHRTAASLPAGLRAHRDDFAVTDVFAMEPMSFDGREMLRSHDVTAMPNEQFLCHPDEFAEWAAGRSSLRMEDFYRWQRTRLDIFMDGRDPVGGQWNFDHDNRERPPTDGRTWPEIAPFPLDEIDEKVLASMPDTWGAVPDGTWPVTRSQALLRLGEFIDTGLAVFGPHEDAMIAEEWKMAHSALASSLNLGLLHPRDLVHAAEAAFHRGGFPVNSVEGFIRQIIGWREYVWGVYWLWMPEYRDRNGLAAHRPVPPALASGAPTSMNCVSSVMRHVHDHGYAHHIERLMVLGNIALTAGVSPQAMTQWMWAGFVDGAEWVMLPNVLGMALHADGGAMATKPYASGGAYINRMSNFCKECRFDPKKRTGDDACPFTTLYWDFLDRNQETFASNHRMAQPLAGLRRLKDLDEVRARAREVLVALDAGEL